MASLQSLEDEVEAVCQARAQAQADAAEGKASLLQARALERAHPLVVSPDTLAALHAALESPRTEETQRPRLLALLPFLRRACEDALTREADEALRSARAAARVSAAGMECALDGAWASVAEEADTARRASLSRATAEAELQLLGAVQRRWEAARRAAQTLPASPPLGQPESAARAALELEAAEFLRRTEDPFREVLGYGLKRLDPELYPRPRGEAGLQDLLRLADTPLPNAFPVGERLEAVRQWLTASGLGLEASGRVRLLENAPGISEASCIALKVPERVLLVLPPKGRGSFAALLDASGRARAAAEVSSNASLAARRLGDGAVARAAGALFRGVMRSEGWLRRFLGHSRGLAREVARLSALARLGELRLLAARLPHSRGLQEAGPSRALLESLAEAVSQALFLAVPAGALLSSLAGPPFEAEALRAEALAEGLRQQADERFDAEDFRNPAAARWLAAVWSLGAGQDASALALEVSGRPLSLASVADALVKALGA